MMTIRAIHPNLSETFLEMASMALKDRRGRGHIHGHSHLHLATALSKLLLFATVLYCRCGTCTTKSFTYAYRGTTHDFEVKVCQAQHSEHTSLEVLVKYLVYTLAEDDSILRPLQGSRNKPLHGHSP